MEQMSEYFSVLTQVIVDEQGTIDKFIGDSIMAFWGAPIAVSHPCQHAALSALKCMEVLKVLNATWEKKGWQPWHTRIGIHMGEAIVGNVGSIDRMNYTAVGEVVNIAKRLESINKKYSTHIMVSEMVYQSLKYQFEFRRIDHVILKGLKHKEYIYELLPDKE